MTRKYRLIFIVTLVVVIMDQLSKYAVRMSLELYESVMVVDPLLYFTYVTNTGSAFGLFKGINIFFIMLSIVVIIVTLYLTKKVKNKEDNIQLAVGLLLGGTIGNLIDRILHGHVIDFIDFRIWPVFNIADSSLTISVILLVILLWDK